MWRSAANHISRLKEGHRRGSDGYEHQPLRGCPRSERCRLGFNMGNVIGSKKALRLYIAVALAGHVSFAQDWPQWRGPNRDGVAASFTAPKVWPDKLKTVWKLQVGLGHSSPVFVGRRVYLLSRQEENEVASCFDLDTGKQLWRDSYPTPYMMNPAAVSHGKGPKSTPVVYNNKLYTLGISGILSCYDAA